MQTRSLHATRLSVFVSVAFASACGAPSHDLGDSPESRPANLEQEPAQQPVAEFTTDFDGVWEGEAENPFSLDVEAGPYRFPSGSSRILLDLSFGEPGSPTITFGDGPALAPPSDPDVMYPPGAESYVRVGYVLEPWEGFSYPAYVGGVKLSDLYALNPDGYGTVAEIELLERLTSEGRVIDGKLSVQYITYDLFRPWCDLQPPDSGCGFDDEPGYYEDDAGNCFDDSGPVDCGKVLLCMNICSQLDGLADLTLQLTTDGLIGMFSGEALFRNERGFLSPIGLVRFRRVSAGE